jgi:hypothetical protein
MAITHYDGGSVKFENGKGGTAVAPIRADGTIIDAGVPSVAGTGIFAATTSTAVAQTAIDVQVVAATTSLRLMGYSFREDAGGTASFILRNGTSTAGTPLAYVTLAAGESVRDWFGPQGKVAAAGIFLDMVSGTVIGQVDNVAVA